MRPVHELVEKFELGTLPIAEFTQEAHLAIAITYLQYYRPVVALERMQNALKGYFVVTGRPQVYSETITTAWMRLLAVWLREKIGGITPFVTTSDFPEYLLKDLPEEEVTEALKTGNVSVEHALTRAGYQKPLSDWDQLLCKLAKGVAGYILFVERGYPLRKKDGTLADNLENGLNSIESNYQSVQRSLSGIAENQLIPVIKGTPLSAFITQLTQEYPKNSLPLQYYSRELFFSEKAKQQFIEPDLKPLPAIL